jgi:hypothetical protein
VTLSRKGAKSGTHGRKLRSSRTKAGSSLDRVRKPRAELEELKARARGLAEGSAGPLVRARSSRLSRGDGAQLLYETQANAFEPSFQDFIDGTRSSVPRRLPRLRAERMALRGRTLWSVPPNIG